MRSGILNSSVLAAYLVLTSAVFAAAPVLEVSPTYLEFSAYEGAGNPANQIVSIWRGGGNGPLNWEVMEDCNWLVVEPNSGKSMGEVDDVNVIVDISGLAAGSYNCQLTVDAGTAVNSPQIIDVNLVICEPNLVSWWKFDEGSGTTAYDSVGDNDGTLVNGPTWTTGQIDGALSFDGSDDWVDLGTDIFSEATFENSGGTLSAWVYPTSTLANRDYVIGIEGRFNIGESATSTNYWKAGIYDGDWQAVKSTSAINVNEWAYLAATWDTTTLKFYVDGVYQGSVAQGTPLIDAVSWPVTIGAYWGNSGGLYYTIPAIIDDVRIYDRALSAEEIWELYREGLGGRAFNPSPVNGAANVDPNVVLSWSPGYQAASHDVYLGTDYNNVNDANTSSPEYKGNQDANSWDPCGLDLLTTYYWRIDEVNDPNLWKGDVWSFETGGPVIELSATQFEFYAFEGGVNPNDQILNISNSSFGTLNWEITHECSWLSAEPNSGSSTGEADDVNLSVDISGLSIGVYDCNVTVLDPNSSNSPQIVSGSLTMLPYVEEAIYVPLDYPTIQAAIDDCNNGGTIVVAMGIYTGAGNRDLDFGGRAITVRSIDPNDPNVVAATVIDCENSGRGFYFHSGEGQTASFPALQ